MGVPPREDASAEGYRHEEIVSTNEVDDESSKHEQVEEDHRIPEEFGAESEDNQHQEELHGEYRSVGDSDGGWISDEENEHENEEQVDDIKRDLEEEHEDQGDVSNDEHWDQNEAEVDVNSEEGDAEDMDERSIEEGERDEDEADVWHDEDAYNEDLSNDDIKVDFVDGRYIIELDDEEELKCAYGAEDNTFALGSSSSSTKQTKPSNSVASRLHHFAKMTTNSAAPVASTTETQNEAELPTSGTARIAKTVSGGISSVIDSYNQSPSLLVLSGACFLFLVIGLLLAIRARRRKTFASLHRPAPLLTTTRVATSKAESTPPPVYQVGGGHARRPSSSLLPSQQSLPYDRRPSMNEPMSPLVYPADASPLPNRCASRTPGEPVSPMMVYPSTAYDDSRLSAKSASPFPSYVSPRQVESSWPPARLPDQVSSMMNSVESPRPPLGGAGSLARTISNQSPQLRSTPTSPFQNLSSGGPDGSGGLVRRPSSGEQQQHFVRRPSAPSPLQQQTSPGPIGGSPYSNRPMSSTGYYDDAVQPAFADNSDSTTTFRRFSTGSAPPIRSDSQADMGTVSSQYRPFPGTRPAPIKHVGGLMRSESAPVETSEPTSPFLPPGTRSSPAHSADATQQWAA